MPQELTPLDQASLFSVDEARWPKLRKWMMAQELAPLPQTGLFSEPKIKGDDPLPGGGRLRWVNDWPEDNFQKKIAKGYLIVERDGKQITRSAGFHTGGLQYLMQVPPMLSYEAAPDQERLTYNDIIDIVAKEVPEEPMIEAKPTKRQRLIKWLDKHKRGKRVRDRILRLNHSIREGERIRGWHPAQTLSNLLDAGVMGKKEFIARHGREALAKVPKRFFIKRGKRAYITIEAVQDHVWERL